MTDERPSKADRDAARDVVRSALESGRIIQADHDQRLQAVDNAETKRELGMILTGLPAAADQQWREYDPPSAGTDEIVHEPDATPSVSAGPPPPPPPTGGGSAPYVPYGGAQTPSFSSTASGVGVAIHTGSRMIGIVIAVVVLTTVVGAGIAIFFVARSGLPDSVVPGRPDMHSQAGLDDMIAAVKEEKGSTLAFSANLFGDYAIVAVPSEEGSQREDSYYFDGTLDDWTKSTSTYEPFDLEDINGDALDDLCEEARSRIEDPKDCSIYVHAPFVPDDKGEPAYMTASVSNDYGENASVMASLDGEIVETP